jgi:hypothetical protein
MPTSLARSVAGIAAEDRLRFCLVRLRGTGELRQRRGWPSRLSPKDRHAIAGQCAILGDERRSFDHGLSDQHPIEGIPVQMRQGPEPTQMDEGDRKHREAFPAHDGFRDRREMRVRLDA